jgi:hypothetical protein
MIRWDSKEVPFEMIRWDSKEVLFEIWDRKGARV